MNVVREKGQANIAEPAQIPFPNRCKEVKSILAKVVAGPNHSYAIADDKVFHLGGKNKKMSNE